MNLTLHPAKLAAPLPAHFRRCVRLEVEDGAAHAELEDDFHRLGVTVRHDGRWVTGLEGRAGRHPWDTCPAAIGKLQALEGVTLTRSVATLQEATDIRLQCTHLFDLAVLAITAAARGGSRVYDADVTVEPDFRAQAVLEVDGRPLLHWSVEGAAILEAPPPFAGVSLKAGFPQWAEANLAVDAAEAAYVLRRCLLVANGKRVAADWPNSAVEAMTVMAGACHSFQADVARVARRPQGWSRSAEGMHPRALRSDWDPAG